MKRAFQPSNQQPLRNSVVRRFGIRESSGGSCKFNMKKVKQQQPAKGSSKKKPPNHPFGTIGQHHHDRPSSYWSVMDVLVI